MDEHTIREALDDCLSAVSARNCPFSSWDREFLESVAERWEEKQHLTERQQDALRDIWDKV